MAVKNHDYIPEAYVARRCESLDGNSFDRLEDLMYSSSDFTGPQVTSFVDGLAARAPFEVPVLSNKLLSGIYDARPRTTKINKHDARLMPQLAHIYSYIQSGTFVQPISSKIKATGIDLPIDGQPYRLYLEDVDSTTFFQINNERSGATSFWVDECDISDEDRIRLKPRAEATGLLLAEAFDPTEKAIVEHVIKNPGMLQMAFGEVLEFSPAQLMLMPSEAEQA